MIDNVIAYFESKGSALELDKSMLGVLVVGEVKVDHHTAEGVLTHETVKGFGSYLNGAILLRRIVGFLRDPGDLTL